MPHLTSTTAARLATTALAAITREYPNQIAHAMASDADAATPRQLHPAFYACYDWHSAVHTHWCLVRLLRKGAGHSRPQATWADHAIAILDQHLTPTNIAVETAYLAAPGRITYERPYGLAWLLQLDAELTEWSTPNAARWRAALQPLAQLSAERLITWFTNLTHPIRTGVHSQSAFAMALTLDWARATNNHAAAKAVADRALALHANDTNWSFTFEPSGEDFLSPGLAAADLMRRVLPQKDFAAWLDQALPDLRAESPHPLAPIQPKDTTDGRLAHLDGLSLSRAWMLDAIAAALDPVHHASASRAKPHDNADPCPAHLRALAATHLTTGLAAATTDDYTRTHWLATFATYALTRPGSA